MAAKSARRWYQFSLKALLVLVTLSSLPPAVYVGYKRYVVAKRLAEIESSFVWLESLGYPQLPNGKPIRITTKSWYGDESPQKSQNDVALGFLLSQDAKSFTVLTPDLETITWERQSRDEWANSDADFERLDLRTLARLALEQSDAQTFPPFDRIGKQLSERGELFILAWACARQGHPDWAIKLYERAESDLDSDDADKSFQERLAADFAHMETWRATLDCQTQTPRSDLLKKFRWLQQCFPNSEHEAEIAAKVAILETMVSEDERHALQRKASLPFQKLSKSQQIDELIFQLRDQNGYQWSQPGWCDVLATRDGHENSPGHQLLAYGYDAVPQLAAALRDQRLTRSIGYHRSFYFSHAVLTVGDAAEQILHRIAGRGFDTDDRDESEEARIAAVQKKALAWHVELMAKGERLCLVGAVQRGDRTSVDLATRLVEKYPDDGCSAILAAIPVAQEDDYRQSFIELLGRVHSDLSVPFLVGQLQHDKARMRLTAARALTDLGRPEGIDAMLHQWQSSEEVAALEGVGAFLVEFGGPEAVDAVAQRFSQQPIDERLETMEKVLRTDLEAQAKPRLRKAMIQLLLVALKDTDVRAGMSGSLGNKSYEDPRVCDLAGYYLNALDAAKFRFDLAEPLSQRETARRAILQGSRD